MRNISLIFVALVLIMAASAWAEPTACPTVREWQPAGLGAGPAVDLSPLTGCDFDTAYVALMYQQQSDVDQLAAYGADKVSDEYLKNFAGKIIHERNDENAKLVSLPGCIPNATEPSAEPQRVSAITMELANCTGAALDQAWVKSMMVVLMQSKKAADLAITRATTPALQAEAKLASRTSGNEFEAFKRWQDTGFLNRQDYRRYCAYNYTNDARCLWMPAPP